MIECFSFETTTEFGSSNQIAVPSEGEVSVCGGKDSVIVLFHEVGCWNGSFRSFSNACVVRLTAKF